MFVYELYHAASKKKIGTPRDVSEWPAEWTTTHIKVYERFPRVPLPPPRDLDIQLSEVIRNRSSVRERTRTLDAADVSDILFYGCGEKDPRALHGRGSRVYASAGARFPLEVYVFLPSGVGSIGAGIYHYAVETHELVRIASCDASVMQELWEPAHAHTAQCAVVVTAIFERSACKYGEGAYRHVLIETGMVTAHMHLVATAHKIGSVSLNAFSDALLESALDIDGVSESVIHTVVFD
jgi:SagB-type dehydrogenase family enzyme